LKSQVERSRSVPDLLLFGYKVTRMEWLQLGNILLKSGTIKLQKINGTEPLRSQPARTARPLIRAQQLARLSLQPNKKQSHSVPVHSATKQKTESLRSSLPNTEQSGSIPKIRNRATPFYLAPQPNTTLVKRRSGFSLSPRFTRSRPRASQLVAAHHGPEILLQINQIAALRPVFLSQLGRRVRHGCAGLLLRGRLRLRSPPFFHDASTPAHPLRTCATTSSSSSPRRHPPRSLPPRASAATLLSRPHLLPHPHPPRLLRRRSGFSLSPRFTRSRPRASQRVAAHHGPEILLQINQIAVLRPVFLSQLGRRVRNGCAGLLLHGRLRLRSPPFFHDASTPAHPLRTCATTSSSSSPRRHPPRSLPPRAGAVTCCRARTSFPIRACRGSSGSSATRPTATCPHVHRCLVVSVKSATCPLFLQIKSVSRSFLPSPSSPGGWRWPHLPLPVALMAPSAALAPVAFRSAFSTPLASEPTRKSQTSDFYDPSRSASPIILLLLCL
jgi:hypothetical protein